MRLNVTFRSSVPYAADAHPVGEELANYLRERFAAAGIPISNVDNYEDFGWSLDTTRGGKQLFLLLGFVGDGDCEWLLQINAYTASFWDLFRRNLALAEREALAPLVHAALAGDTNFSAIRWHVGDFAAGQPAATPG